MENFKKCSLSPRFKQLKCYRYKNTSEKLSKYLRSANQSVGPITDWTAKAAMEEQGFYFDESTDARSLYKPEDLFEGLKAYDNPSTFNPDKKNLSVAYRMLEKEFSHLFGTISPMSEESVIHFLNKKASAGAPTFEPKEEILNKGRKLNYRDAFTHPCTAYHRSQSRMKESGDFKQSVRLIWGYPMEATIIEGKYARPLIEAFKLSKTSYVLGLRKYEMGARLQHFQWAPFVGSFDWSKFDSTIPSQIISLVFKLLKRMFSSVNELEWHDITKYFICTPILMPNGKVYFGKNRGIPSGSYFTNVIGSLVNLLLMRYLQVELKFKLRDVCVHGDDSIVASNCELPLKQMGLVAESCFGMILHPDKQRYTSKDHDLEFLSHSWRKGIPYRDVKQTVHQWIFTERGYPRNEEPGYVRYMRMMQLVGDNKLFWPVAYKYMRKAGTGFSSDRNWQLMVVNRSLMREDDRVTAKLPVCLGSII